MSVARHTNKLRPRNPLTGKPATGVILYEGPSLLDGAPIVAVATGIARPSSNIKTGKMVQVWILRADVDPVRAVRLGLDESICGACPMRGAIAASGLPIGGRRCYVQVAKAPLGVWQAYQRGAYPQLDPASADWAEIVHGRTVRLGAYGDPAAVPMSILQATVAPAEAHTGYTHQWRDGFALAHLLMASVESVTDARIAWAMGYRTFRVSATVAEDAPVRGAEARCPASAEAGAVLSCEQCRACGGTASAARASRVTQDHGPQRARLRVVA